MCILEQPQNKHNVCDIIRCDISDAVNFSHMSSLWNDNRGYLTTDGDYKTCAETGFETNPWIILGFIYPDNFTSVYIQGKISFKEYLQNLYL